MSVLRAGLLHQLLAPRVAPYFEAASSLVSQHFDVFLFTSKDEAQFVLHNIATEFLCQTPNRFDLPASVADIGVLNKNGRGKPLLYVSDVLLPRGSGFVELKVPPVLELLPSLSQIVSQVLNHLGLSQFIDAFDGRRMSQLREILRARGLSEFIDVVVQIAYLAGSQGDDAAANQMLTDLVAEIRQNEVKLRTGGAPAERAVNARKFFNELLTTASDPHGFSKVALSYFVVHGMGYNLTSASRILKVSRSTVQDHLAKAEATGVQEYFGPSLNSDNRRNFVG